VYVQYQRVLLQSVLHVWHGSNIVQDTVSRFCLELDSSSGETCLPTRAFTLVHLSNEMKTAGASKFIEHLASHASGVLIAAAHKVTCMGNCTLKTSYC
jgi:hypothetical protein